MPPPNDRSPRPVLLLALAAAASGCRPGAPPPPLPPPAVQLAPAVARYALVEHRHVEQRYQDQPIVTDAVTRAVLTVAVESGPSGFVLAVVVDSLSVTGEAGIPPDAVAATMGRRFRAELTPTGTVRAMTDGSGAANTLVDQLAMRLHDLVPTLPPGGAGPDARWDDTAHARGRTAGIPTTIEARASHEAAAWTDLEGRAVLPLDTRITYTLAGEGERAGQWLGMAGTGSGRIRWFVTGDGLAALGVRSDTLLVTIDLPAAGLQIPLTQIRADTLRRLD